MAKETITRNNGFTNADLYALCNNKCVYFYQDIAEFNKFGITTATIDAFKVLNRQFIDIPSDDELENVISSLTNDKNELRNQVLLQIRNMEMRAKLAFGAKNPIMNQFYKKLLYNTNDIDLLFFSRSVAQAAQSYLSDLSVYGLTQALLDEYVLLNQNYENAMNNQKNAITNRENLTKNRTNTANELFDKLKKYCEIGKTIFIHLNVAKYKNYLIYNGAKSNLPASVRKFAYNTDRFKWNPNAKASSFELQELRQIRQDKQWKSIGTTTNTEFEYSIKPDITEYRIRAINEFGNGIWREIKVVVKK